MDTLTVSTLSFREEANRALQQWHVDRDNADTAYVLLFDSTPWRRFHEEATHLLSPMEQERALRFRYSQHRDTYVLAHAFWRLALSALLTLETHDVPLISTATGQPQLPKTAYATSLSHSGNHVAIAIGSATALGVDIEQSPPRQGLHSLVSVLCAPTEAAALQSLAPDDRDLALLALWTRKEALLKAFGVGLRESPSTIAADMGRIIEPPPSVASAPACCVQQLSLPHGLVGALAAPPSIVHVALHWLMPPSHSNDRVAP
ncbi:4'-phosphopantetheinyl transferase family protein [Dyella sp. 20L07]|uniref:4'-phosphopantetheinyl transferase family protein n=1 Tax=Dyella sp. 20L07 TaxID=3384240 RepID=UPI003D28791E